MLSKRISILLLVAALAPCVLSAEMIDRIAAIVNSEVITYSEVTAMKQLGLDVSDLPEKENILQRRVDEHLVLQQVAKQPPVSLSAEDVQSLLDSFASRHGGREELLLFLNSIGMSYADLEQEARDQLTIRNFLRARFRPFINIPLEQAEKYYTEIYKPALEQAGKPVPSFAESFDQIQGDLAQSQVLERTREWLVELRRSASITVKE